MSKKTGTRRSAKKSTTAMPILDPNDGNLPLVSTQEPIGDTVNTTVKPRPRPRIVQNSGSAGTIVLPGTSSKKTPLLASPDSANENTDTLSTQETSADTGPPPALSSVSTRGPAQPSTVNPRPKPKNSTSAQQTSADTGRLPLPLPKPPRCARLETTLTLPLFRPSLRPCTVSSFFNVMLCR